MNLLPLSPDPFTAATDRDMLPSERRDFVRTHRTCVFGYERKQGPPSMSVVYYTMDGDDILISTMAGRAKAKAVERLGEVSICVLDEKWPLTYLVVYGKARLERDLQQTGTVMMKVGEIMSGNPIPEAARKQRPRGTGLRRQCGHRPWVGRVVMHTAQGAFDDPVTLKAPPLRSTAVAPGKPGLEHRGQQQIEQPVQHRGLARLILDHFVAE